jgi:hypothetical protein
LALLPTVPVVLLVLRLWLLSRQNLQTMLTLVQHVSPLGLISALVVTLLWAPPAVVLTLRALSALLAVSDPGTKQPASWLARAGARIPDWVVWLAVASAAISWQLRFLPALLMLTWMIVGLLTRERHPDQPILIHATCLVLPAVTASAAYVLLAPGIADAITTGEAVNCLLLLLPPGLTILLTGPIPKQSARAVTHIAALSTVALFPLLITMVFLRAPILPTVAVELAGQATDPPTQDVVRGQVITVDDRMTTLLNRDGSVRFILNDTIRSKTLCDTSEQVPASATDVRGWHVEQTVLEWLTPQSRPVEPDPRCDGRPLQAPSISSRHGPALAK